MARTKVTDMDGGDAHDFDNGHEVDNDMVIEDEDAPSKLGDFVAAYSRRLNDQGYSLLKEQLKSQRSRRSRT